MRSRNMNDELGFRAAAPAWEMKLDPPPGRAPSTPSTSIVVQRTSSSLARSATAAGECDHQSRRASSALSNERIPSGSERRRDRHYCYRILMGAAEYPSVYWPFYGAITREAG